MELQTPNFEDFDSGQNPVGCYMQGDAKMGKTAFVFREFSTYDFFSFYA